MSDSSSPGACLYYSPPRQLKTKSRHRNDKKSNYKHVPHSLKPAHLVAKRNARERSRVQAVNLAFSRLRKHVPFEPRHKRLSKVKTLRVAIDYIQHLQQLIDRHDNILDAPTTTSDFRGCQIFQTCDFKPETDGTTREANLALHRSSSVSEIPSSQTSKRHLSFLPKPTPCNECPSGQNIHNSEIINASFPGNNFTQRQLNFQNGFVPCNNFQHCNPYMDCVRSSDESVIPYPQNLLQMSPPYKPWTAIDATKSYTNNFICGNYCSSSTSFDQSGVFIEVSEYQNYRGSCDKNYNTHQNRYLPSLPIATIIDGSRFAVPEIETNKTGSCVLTTLSSDGR
ncbi:helix-loop-helix protein 4-like [Physella acuta]|uniref:helix-loop-helix protein 4-like n=1 Tax=Physella acuta TaxID=109671 RepID=UPI0027DE5E63|nr:helix-loop-helix protein 4-like [Physella acuta]